VSPGALPTAGEQVEVRLLGVPVALLEESREHLDSLERELRLLDLTGADGSPEVARLLELLAEAGLAELVPGRADDEALETARRRRDDTLDVIVRVAPGAADAARELVTLLDEADRFCRRGELLNLATPAECVALRRWYLGEVVAQVEGAPPSPWPSTH
jgi:hypothetical protein